MAGHAYALHIHHMTAVWQVIAVRLGPAYHNDPEGILTRSCQPYLLEDMVVPFYVCYFPAGESVQ